MQVDFTMSDGSFKIMSGQQTTGGLEIVRVYCIQMKVKDIVIQDWSRVPGVIVKSRIDLPFEPIEVIVDPTLPVAMIIDELKHSMMITQVTVQLSAAIQGDMDTFKSLLEPQKLQF
jgi:hypothetical protein